MLAEFRCFFPNCMMRPELRASRESVWGMLYQSHKLQQKTSGILPLDYIFRGRSHVEISHTNMRQPPTGATNRKLTKKLRHFYANVILQCNAGFFSYKEETFQQVSTIHEIWEGSACDASFFPFFFWEMSILWGERSTKNWALIKASQAKGGWCRYMCSMCWHLHFNGLNPPNRHTPNAHSFPCCLEGYTYTYDFPTHLQAGGNFEADAVMWNFWLGVTISSYRLEIWLGTVDVHNLLYRHWS